MFMSRSSIRKHLGRILEQPPAAPRRVLACAIALVAACGGKAADGHAPGAGRGGSQEAAQGGASAAAQSGSAAPTNDGGSVSRGTGTPTGGSAGGSAGAATAAGGAGARTTGSNAAGAGGHAGTQPDAAADGGSPAASCERCSAYGAPQQSGTIEPDELDALSGLATSRAQPGIVYAHNDHNRPVVYALDFSGKLHARISLDGAPATDFEDIAVGPCGSDSCVFLADIGDNAAVRSEYAILRFKEPKVPETAGTTALSPAFERVRFVYPDGSHNAESLLAAPDGALYVITKLAPGTGGAVNASGPSSVYKLEAAQLDPGKLAQAVKVTTLSVPKSGEAALSAAAAHPCGEGVLVRTYDRVYEFLTPAGADFEQAFSAVPSVVAEPDEPQSEGIDYLPDGKGFISSGEGARAPIFRTECAR
jgi:hypothetical protein